MTLRRKTLLIVGIILTLLFILLSVAVSRILMSGFLQVEAQEIERNIARVQEAIEGEIEDVNSTVRDYAVWTDTYNFVSGDNLAYLENLGVDAFTNIRVNFMLFYDLNHELYFAREVDSETETETGEPEGILNYLAEDSSLLQHENKDSYHKGLLLLSENPVLIASQPILQDGQDGEPNGTLIMGRYLDETLIAALGERTRLELQIIRLDQQEDASAMDRAAIDRLTGSSGTSIYSEPLSDTSVAAYQMRYDLEEQPALLLRTNMPRSVFAQGQISLRALYISLIASGVISVLTILFLLERLVLRKLSQLSTNVSEIGASGDMSRRVVLPGADELSKLAQSINDMLQDLQDSLAREEKLQEEVRELRIEIDRVKQRKQVKEIIETDFFSELQSKAQEIRQRDRRHKDE